MRHLRDYESVAQTHHFCDYCCRDIMQGEQYRGTVYATEKHIVVVKQHINPARDFPPEDEYEIFGLGKNESQLEVVTKEEASRAA